MTWSFQPDVDKNPDVVNIIHINSVHKMEPRDYNPGGLLPNSIYVDYPYEIS